MQPAIEDRLAKRLALGLAITLLSGAACGFYYAYKTDQILISFLCIPVLVGGFLLLGLRFSKSDTSSTSSYSVPPENPGELLGRILMLAVMVPIVWFWFRIGNEENNSLAHWTLGLLSVSVLLAGVALALQYKKSAQEKSAKKPIAPMPFLETLPSAWGWLTGRFFTLQSPHPLETCRKRLYDALLSAESGSASSDFEIEAAPRGANGFRVIGTKPSQSRRAGSRSFALNILLTEGPTGTQVGLQFSMPWGSILKQMGLIVLVLACFFGKELSDGQGVSPIFILLGGFSLASIALRHVSKRQDREQLTGMVMATTDAVAEPDPFPVDPSGWDLLVRRFRRLSPWHQVLVRWTLGGLALWFLYGPIVRVAAACFPVSWELRLGARMDPEKAPAVQDPAVQTAVTALGEELLSHASRKPYPFTFQVVRSDVENAYAVPGGRIVIYTGLIKRMESVDELAAVLGHEIGHIVEKHSLEKVLHASALPLMVSALLGTDLGSDLSQMIFGRHFSRSEETEADRVGLMLASKAGFDPRAAAVFWERMETQSKAQWDFTATHPSSRRRASALASLAQSLPQHSRSSGLRIDWATFKRRALSASAT